MRALRFLIVLSLTACAAPSIGGYPGEDDPLALPEREEGESSSAQTASTPASEKVKLTVTLEGTGKIVSSPPGLACSGNTCTGSFTKDTVVSLTPTPEGGASFAGWSGACSGTATCAPKVSGDTNVGAKFSGLAGTWRGTYTNVRPANGCTFNNGGDLTVTMTNDTTKVDMTGLEIRAPLLRFGCRVVGRRNGASAPSPVASTNGTLTGTWDVAVQDTSGTLAFPFTATINGNTMTGSWTCPNCTGSFTLTRQ